MAWIYEAGSQDTPYNQWKGELLNYGIDDREAKAEVANIYQKGGRSLSESECPKLLKFGQSKPAVRSINQVSEGAIVVDEDFKTVVETFDFGIHQFVPLDVQFGKVSAERRFLWNVHIICDEVDWASTTTKTSTNFSGKSTVKIVLRKKNVALKTEPGEERPHVFRLQGAPRVLAISDRLKTALDEKNLLKSAPLFRATRTAR